MPRAAVTKARDPGKTRAPACALAAATLAAALVMFGATTGWAQPLPDEATRAKAHYELGMTAYGLGHYDRAVQAFTEAYQVDPAPILLYNIGQAHWKNGDRERALAYYQRYLEADPRAKNRDQVRSRIRALQADLKENPHAAPPAPASVAAPPAVEATAPAGPPPPGPASPSAGPWARPAPAAEPAPAAAPAPATDPAGPWARPDRPPATEPPAARAPVPPELPRLDPVMPAPLPADVLATAPPRQAPIHRRPWFWPAVGAVGLITVATIFLFRPDDRNWTCGPACSSTREVP